MHPQVGQQDMDREFQAVLSNLIEEEFCRRRQA
jgi:hypothetical protein